MGTISIFQTKKVVKNIWLIEKYITGHHKVFPDVQKNPIN